MPLKFFSSLFCVTPCPPDTISFWPDNACRKSPCAACWIPMKGALVVTCVTTSAKLFFTPRSRREFHWGAVSFFLDFNVPQWFFFGMVWWGGDIRNLLMLPRLGLWPWQSLPFNGWNWSPPPLREVAQLHFFKEPFRLGQFCGLVRCSSYFIHKLTWFETSGCFLEISWHVGRWRVFWWKSLFSRLPRLYMPARTAQVLCRWQSFCHGISTNWAVWPIQSLDGRNLGWKKPETSRKTCRESLLQGGINVYVWILNWWRWYLNLASWWGREGANKLTGTELIQSFSHLPKICFLCWLGHLIRALGMIFFGC